MFAIVEVKVEAKEGDQQTPRYYENRKLMMEELGINRLDSSFETYKFLTLYGEKAIHKKFEAITWEQVGECIPEIAEIHSDLELYMRDLKRRCDTLECDFTSADLWKDVTRRCGWRTSLGMFQALQMLFDNTYNIRKHSYTFSTSNAKNVYRVVIGKKKWVSKNDVSRLDKIDIASQCFNVHFEFEWNIKEEKIKSMVHLEFNPYLSASDLNKVKEGAKTTNPNLVKYIDQNTEKKKKVAQDGRIWWSNNNSNKHYKYNERISKNIYCLASYEFKVKDTYTADDVIQKIKPFIQIGKRLIDEKIIPDLTQ